MLALLAACGVQAAELQVYNLLDFQFENGAILSDLRIGYETSGTLSASRDNAILLIHGTSNNRHAFDAVIGPGKTFDTDRYFVITADAIGGGDSSSPRDDGLARIFRATRCAISQMRSTPWSRSSSGYPGCVRFTGRRWARLSASNGASTIPTRQRG